MVEKSFTPSSEFYIHNFCWNIQRGLIERRVVRGYVYHDTEGTSAAYRASESLLHECLYTPYTHCQPGALDFCKVPLSIWKYQKIQ